MDLSVDTFNALTDPIGTRPARTCRRDPPGADSPPVHFLYARVWLSHGLAGGPKAAQIDRCIRHDGDGSDHDPTWVTP